MLGDQTGRFNLWLIKALSGRSRFGYGPRDPDTFARLRETQTSDENPEQRVIYLGYLGLTWVKAAIICGITVSLIGYVIDKVNSFAAYHFSRKAIVFTMAFCLIGALDTVWRAKLAEIATRRYEAANRVVDDRTRKLMRRARVNDATLVLQLVGAILATWLIRYPLS